MIGKPLEALVPAGAGANSHVFRAEAGSERYAIKFYPLRPSDMRPRVANEWRTLNFLRQNGVAAVPRPLACDIDRAVLVMEWLEGDSIRDLHPADIEECLAFVAQIFTLSQRARAEEFDAASEACLSGSEICRQIEARLGGFIAHPGLEEFLAEIFRPLLAKAAVAAARLDQFHTPLPPALQRLIPADFGFHNAIRIRSGELRFIDFDYFGWDDPVKLAADFVLHPAMTLSLPQQEQFVAGLARFVAEDVTFYDRFRCYKPLYALRWALILLNPFQRERQTDPRHSEALFAQQLSKASALCASISAVL